MINNAHKTWVTIQSTIIKAVDEKTNTIESFHVNGKLNIIDSKKLVDTWGFVYIAKSNHKNSFFVNTGDLVKLALKPDEEDFRKTEDYLNAKEDYLFLKTSKDEFANYRG